MLGFHRRLQSIGLCLTLSRYPVNHKKTTVAQNGCQKWKEHNENSNTANFEATDVKVRDLQTVALD